MAEGHADGGVSVLAAARLFSLEFLPWQEERYDLVIPKAVLGGHRRVGAFLDTLVSRPFRIEMEALGGYDTRETGKLQQGRVEP